MEITEFTPVWVHIGHQAFCITVTGYTNGTGPMHRDDFPSWETYYLARVHHPNGWSQNQGIHAKPQRTIIESFADGMRMACLRYCAFDMPLEQQYGR